MDRKKDSVMAWKDYKKVFFVFIFKTTLFLPSTSFKNLLKKQPICDPPRKRLFLFEGMTNLAKGKSFLKYPDL